MEKKKEPVCRFGHICTSRCGNDIECPCLSDHCCEISVSQGYCDGTCDDCCSKDNYELPGFKETMMNLEKLTIMKKWIEK